MAKVTIQTSRNFIFLEFIYDRVNKAKVGLTDHLGGQGKWWVLKAAVQLRLG